MWNFYLPPSPSSYAWAPSWSPDAKSIAIGFMGSIWRVNVASGEATEITRGASYHSSPAWSPDGKWIVYTADRNGESIHLEILNVATGETRALTAGSHLYLDPAWSPGGKTLAYVSTRPSGYFNVYTRALENGQWSGEETAVTRDNAYERDRLYMGKWDMHIEPAWLKNGREMLLVSNRGVPLGSGHVWRVPATADAMRDGRVVLAEQSLFRGRPDVSPDGKRFVYSSSGGAADRRNHLYVLPVEGGAPYKLTFGDYDEFHPRWSPDGESIAYISNQGGLPRLVVLEAYGGGKKVYDLANRKWLRPMGKLQARVVGPDGNPTPARVYYLAADGKFYPPADAYPRIGLNERHLLHTTGSFTADLPPGRVRVEAVKGFEFEPASADAEIKPGETASVTLRLKRFAEMKSSGWYSGSTHVHMNYGGNLHNTLSNLLMMSRAEDQQVVNELVANKDNRILDYEAFVTGGGEHPISKGDSAMKVIVGEEYRPPFYGHVFYLGLKDHLISPFTTGYEGTGIESLYPSNTDMFRKARAQGAVTGYVHAYSGDEDPLDGNLGVAKAFPVDAALGTTDALEWSIATRAQTEVWHKLLNAGLRITPTGGEDSISNLHRMKLVASVRTYVKLAKSPLTAEGWLDGLRAGRTFYSSGPLLEFSVDRAGPGEEIQLSAAGGTLTLKGVARSIVPLSQVIIYRNGEKWKQIPLAPGGREARFEEKVPVSESSWFTLYAEGPAHPLIDANYPAAETNAVQVIVGGRPIRNRAASEYFIRWVDKLTAMATDWPWWRSDKEKASVLGQFREARRVWERLAAEGK